MNENQIITAAHCVHKTKDFIIVPAPFVDKNLKTKLGPNIFKCQELDELEYRDIEDIEIHKDYQEEGYINDIAIITVDQKFLFKEREIWPSFRLAHKNASEQYNNKSNVIRLIKNLLEF